MDGPKPQSGRPGVKGATKRFFEGVPMRTKTVLSLNAALAALALTATPAAAHDLGGGFTINGGATVVSDYRFRGISQTDRRFAVQGTLSLGHSSGFYATVWGSSIDDYVAAGSDQEIDISVGWRRTYGNTTVDVGVLYYYYPNSSQFIPGYNSDFVEPYASVSHVVGPVTAEGHAPPTRRASRRSRSAPATRTISIWPATPRSPSAPASPSRPISGTASARPT